MLKFTGWFGMKRWKIKLMVSFFSFFENKKELYFQKRKKNKTNRCVFKR